MTATLLPGIAPAIEKLASRPASAKRQRGLTIAERFWAKVDKSDRP